MAFDNRDAGQIRMDDAAQKMFALPEVQENLRQQAEEMLWHEVRRLHENVAKLHAAIILSSASASAASKILFEEVLKETGYESPE